MSVAPRRPQPESECGKLRVPRSGLPPPAQAHTTQTVPQPHLSIRAGDNSWKPGGPGVLELAEGFTVCKANPVALFGGGTGLSNLTRH